MNKEIRQHAADIEARIKNGFRFYSGWPPLYQPVAADQQMRNRPQPNQNSRPAATPWALPLKP